MATQDPRGATASVVILETQEAARAALGAMRASGSAALTGRVSLIARARDRLAALCWSPREVAFQGRDGPFWSDLAVATGGAAFVNVPPFGSLAALGPIVHALAAAKPGQARGKDALTIAAALVLAGVARNELQRCESALWADQFVLIVHPPEQDGARGEGEDSRAASPPLKLV
jgi:hypothetical protein